MYQFESITRRGRLGGQRLAERADSAPPDLPEPPRPAGDTLTGERLLLVVVDAVAVGGASLATGARWTVVLAAPALTAAGLYRPRLRFSALDDAPRILLGVGAIGLAGGWVPPPVLPRPTLLWPVLMLLGVLVVGTRPLPRRRAGRGRRRRSAAGTARAGRTRGPLRRRRTRRARMARRGRRGGFALAVGRAVADPAGGAGQRPPGGRQRGGRPRRGRPASAGALVPPERPDALADAVARRLCDPALAGAEGRAAAAYATQFDVHRTFDRLAGATLAALGKPTGPSPARILRRGRGAVTPTLRSPG